MTRSTQIEHRLVWLLRDRLSCDVELVDASQWRHDLARSPRYRYGYAPPTPTQPPVVRLCPVLLDEITSWLTDDELDVYLMAVEAFLAAHLVLRDASSDEIMQYLENELLADALYALRLMTEVEMRALDDRLV